VRAKPGTDLDDVKASVDAAMTRFEQSGVDSVDLRRIKAEQETIIYNGLSTVLGKSRNLAQNNEFAGDPAYSVTAYDTYIKDKPYIMTSFVPKGQAELAVSPSLKKHPRNMTAPNRPLGTYRC